MQIVQNAMRMASLVSLEPDMLDRQWTGLNGRNPLWELLGTTTIAETVESILKLVASLEETVAQ